MISLMSLCICFSLQYTHRIVFPEAPGFQENWVIKNSHSEQRAWFLSFTFLSNPYVQWRSEHFSYLLVIEIRVGRDSFCRVVSWVRYWLGSYSKIFHSNFLHVVVVNHHILQGGQRFLSRSIFLGSKPAEVWRFGNSLSCRESSQGFNQIVA